MGIIGWNGVGALKLVEGNLRAQNYRDSIINDLREAGLAISNRGRSFVFQQDGAPAHTAGIVTQYLRARNIQVLPWCGNSPDLNPIEHVWSVVARAADYSATTKAQLFDAVKRAWLQVDVSYVRSLFRSMPSRLAEVVSQKGGSTHY